MVEGAFIDSEMGMDFIDKGLDLELDIKEVFLLNDESIVMESQDKMAYFLLTGEAEINGEDYFAFYL